MTMTDNIAPGSSAVAAFARDLVADAMARGYFDELKDDLYDA
jgi:hypothetical protein